jgi:cytosolic carboxypeptidase protein 2/3
MRKIMLEFTKNHDKYDKIFHNYIIKIIPMINPDGVVIGNSRCSLAGLDLNRRWSEPNPIMHPEIFYIKSNMKLVEKQSGGISMFCDLHGHNKQMNAFIYGCNKAPNEGLLSWTKTRLLPKILASIEPIFEFNKCVFSQEKFKYNTARVVVWNEFKVTNSFTLETSMFGKKLKTMIEKNN